MSIKFRGIAAVVVVLFIAKPGVAQRVDTENQPVQQAVSNTELSVFVRAVVDVHPQVSAARAALDASSAFEAAASRPLYNPELQLEAEDADSKVRALGISQTFDWGGKRRARQTVAELERQSSAAEFKAIRWQVSIDLLTALANYQTETERSALAEDRVKAMQEFASISLRRLDSGDISQIEMNLAMLASTQARMQLATAVASVAESRQAVTNYVTSTAESQWPKIGVELPPLPSSGASAQDLVMILPQVRAAQLLAEAAGARVSLRERERRVDPTVTLRGGKEDDESLIGLNVTIPLNVRNRFRHEVTAASAEHRQARQVFSDTSRRAYSRFLGARQRYQISQSAWQDWQKTGDVSLQSQGDLLRRLWEAGEISTTDYLVQLRQTLDTSESALELRNAMWRAWFEWMTASGQIETWLGEGS